MKRLQIVQSNIEPDKNVLWLDKYKNLNLYNGDGWEKIPKDINKQSDWLEKDKDKLSFIHNKPYIPNNLKTILDDLEGRLKSLEMSDEENHIIKTVYFPSEFIQSSSLEEDNVIRNVQIIDINNEPVNSGEVIYLIAQDNNIIDPIEWYNPSEVEPSVVLLELGKFYKIEFISDGTVENLSIIPYKKEQENNKYIDIKIDITGLDTDTVIILSMDEEEYSKRVNISLENMYDIITNSKNPLRMTLVENIEEPEREYIKKTTINIEGRFTREFRKTGGMYNIKLTFVGYWELNREFNFEISFYEDKSLKYCEIHLDDYT